MELHYKIYEMKNVLIILIVLNFVPASYIVTIHLSTFDTVLLLYVSLNNKMNWPDVDSMLRKRL